MDSKLGRIHRALVDAEVDVAVLSTIPSVAYATGYVPPWEMWPGYNPYVPDPVVCCVWPDAEPVLVLPDYYAPYGSGVWADVEMYESYSHTRAIDQLAAVGKAISVRLGAKPGRVGYEPRTLPVGIRDGADRASRVWVDIAAPMEAIRLQKFPDEIESMRRSGFIADLIQEAVKRHAADGVREVDLATQAIALAWESVGRRFPILMTLTAGEGTASIGGWEPTDRRIAPGELVCADVAPWLDGYWSDSCNAVVIGQPTDRQEQLFASAQQALQAGLAAARPGVEACYVDDACRSVMRDAGYDYPHHTGHGLGLAHTEAPRITPDSHEVIHEGMVIALEPGGYEQGWGGFRHEHVFVVGADKNELLTNFAHSL